MKKEEEEVTFDVHLKHVEQEEAKSPSPEVKPKPASPEVERLEYHPAEKRERPEVSNTVHIKITINYMWSGQKLLMLVISCLTPSHVLIGCLDKHR